jgi:hypothetical protein
VVLGSGLWSQFLELPQTGSARDVVHRNLDRAEFLDVEDAGVLADIDDPAAYRALTGGTA